MKGVAVWDVPTRLFHWLLVGLFGFMWYSGKAGELEWHRLAGLTLMALILFRILWGLWGSSTARFARFLRGPRAVTAYLRGAGETAPGHNPLGGWSVALMLLLLSVQVGTGLLAVDVDGIESGPLSYLVSFEAGRVASDIHELVFDSLLVLTGLHVLAVLFYLLVRRRNLITPMIAGRDRALAPDAPALARGNLLMLAASVAIAGLVAWWVAGGAPLGTG